MTIATPEAGKTTTEPAAATTDPKAAAASTVTEPLVTQAAVADPKKDTTGDGKPEVKFELKLPEGSHLAADAVERAVARAKELKLTPEEAQADLQHESDLVKTFVEGEKVKVSKQVTAWIDESKKDAEIGGDRFLANAEISKRVVQRFGTEQFKKALNESGLGNHPELIRVFTRIGKAMTEDQLVLPSGNPMAPRSPAEVLYGDASNKEK